MFVNELKWSKSLSKQRHIQYIRASFEIRSQINRVIESRVLNRQVRPDLGRMVIVYRCPTHASFSQHQGWLLCRQQVEPCLALHAFLLVRIIWRESGWVCRHRWIVITVVKLDKEKLKSDYSSTLTLKV